MANNDDNPRHDSPRERRARYHASLTSFGFLLRQLDDVAAMPILSSFRSLLASHIDLLSQLPIGDESTLSVLRWELERFDQELEARSI